MPEQERAAVQQDLNAQSPVNHGTPDTTRPVEPIPINKLAEQFAGVGNDGREELIQTLTDDNRLYEFLKFLVREKRRDLIKLIPETYIHKLSTDQLQVLTADAAADVISTLLSKLKSIQRVGIVPILTDGKLAELLALDDMPLEPDDAYALMFDPTRFSRLLESV